MKIARLVVLTSLVLFVTGCSLLAGQGTGVFIPEDRDTIDTGGNPPISSDVPIADGFDFPVGDRNGRGWGITGYQFMAWSRVSNSWHPGEDWNIPGAGDGDFGKPIYSIAHGKVVFSGWNTAMGNIVLIKHQLADGSQVWSQYAHLDKRWVSAGDIVSRRQQIGTNGKGPNNRFAAHLHFEIRKHDLPSNAWPRTNGQPWVRSRVSQYWLNPSEFIGQNRP